MINSYLLSATKHLIFVSVSLLLSVQAFGQWVILKADADELITKGIKFVYNAEFDSATVAFTKVTQLYPNHPSGYFLDAMVEWWRMQIDRKNTAIDQTFLAKIERELQVCDALLQKDEFDLGALFFKGGALGYRGRYYASRESWLKAANDGREAFDILIRCSKLAPGNHDIMLGTGTYNYFAQVLPEQYPAVKAVMVFLPNGDKKLGVLQLEAASKQARYGAVEAKVVLLQVYKQFERSSGDYYRIAKDLYESYPKNPYFHCHYGRSLVMTGNLTEYEKVWRDIVKAYIAKKAGYDALSVREGLYYVGYALMEQAKYDDALKYFYKCDEASRYLDEDPSGFMVKLNMNIGKIYDKRGQRDLAISQYKKILSWGEQKFSNGTSSHTEAQQYINQPYR